MTNVTRKAECTIKIKSTITFPTKREWEKVAVTELKEIS